MIHLLSLQVVEAHHILCYIAVAFLLRHDLFNNFWLWNRLLNNRPLYNNRFRLRLRLGLWLSLRFRLSNFLDLDQFLLFFTGVYRVACEESIPVMILAVVIALEAFYVEGVPIVTPVVATASRAVLADEADGTLAAPVVVLTARPILALHRVGPVALTARGARVLPSRHGSCALERDRPPPLDICLVQGVIKEYRSETVVVSRDTFLSLLDVLAVHTLENKIKIMVDLL